VEWVEEEDKYYFSIIDVIAVLTDNERPRKYWNDLKEKLKLEGSELSEKIGQMKGFLQVNMVSSSPALQSARNYRLLRQKRVTVRKTIDSLIATYSIENDHELLHNDSDFDGYEKYLDLRVVHP
jgi:hypothetical protein